MKRCRALLWLAPPLLGSVLLLGGHTHALAAIPDAQGSGATPPLATHPAAVYAVLSHDTPTSMTVSLLDTGGRTRARAAYSPGGPLGVSPPPPVVGAGAVWFVDRSGNVHSLAPDQPDRVVTALQGVTPDTLASVAVSPGGAYIFVALVTLPAQGSPPSSPAHTDIVVIADNGTVRDVHRSDDPDWYDHGIIELVGYDVRGPVAIDNAAPLAGPTRHGHPVQLDLAGHELGRLGGAGCQLDTLLPDGTVLCSSSDSASVEVRHRDGSTGTTVPVLADLARTDAVLSPDQRMIAQDGRLWAGGQSASLPDAFQPQGWLDAPTLVGVMVDPTISGDQQIVTVSVAHLNEVVPLPVHALYLGTLGADLVPTVTAPAIGPAVVAPPPPVAVVPGLGERFQAWARTPQGRIELAGGALLLLGYVFRMRLIEARARVPELVALVRGRASTAYHGFMDVREEKPEPPREVPRQQFHNDAGKAPSRAGPPLFAAALSGRAARGVSGNPDAFDRFAVAWMATSALGQRYISIVADPSLPWPRQLEQATMRLKLHPRFAEIAEELVGPWMNSVNRDPREAGQFTSGRIQEVFEVVFSDLAPAVRGR